MYGCCRSSVWLSLWVVMVVVVSFSGRTLAGLTHCTPWEIESKPDVNYTRLAGDWFMVARQDVGIVKEELWNAQIRLNIVKRRDVYATDKALPFWFSHPYGCCILYLDYYGGTSSGDQCVGKKYFWGVGLDSQPGIFKHKLYGVPRYSMLYLLDTDYEDFAVFAHCISALDAQFNFYCSYFNLFLLKRQIHTVTVDVVRTFDTSVTKARLANACTGDVWFKSMLNTDRTCQLSSVNFTTPEFYKSL